MEWLPEQRYQLPDCYLKFLPTDFVARVEFRPYARTCNPFNDFLMSLMTRLLPKKYLQLKLKSRRLLP